MGMVNTASWKCEYNARMSSLPCNILTTPHKYSLNFGTEPPSVNSGYGPGWR